MRYLVALGEENEEKQASNNKGLVDVALRHAIPGKDCLLFARVVEELKPDPAIVLLDILYLYVKNAFNHTPHLFFFPFPLSFSFLLFSFSFPFFCFIHPTPITTPTPHTPPRTATHPTPLGTSTSRFFRPNWPENWDVA